MRTSQTLRDEHQGVLMVLEQLERATGAAARGAAVATDVFEDIQEFFAVFVDRCHHGKEEGELFPRLLDGPDAWLVARLEDEHLTGRRLAAAYAGAVAGYQPGQTVSGEALAKAARDYAAFLRAHIALENEALLPAADRLADQDEAIWEGFERIEEERIGPGTHERLHGMIERLPARIEPWLRAG